jgi:hypothetical protein
MIMEKHIETKKIRRRPNRVYGRAATFIDISGQRFSRLTAIEPTGVGAAMRWVCRCDCGATKNITSNDLRSGHTRSCGCLAREEVSRRSKKHGESYSGGSGIRTREYRAWEAAKRRCFNPRDQKYPDYGARGITMCEEWRDDYSAFLRDMGRAPEKCTIDRIDVNGHYEPGNCRWATPKEQVNNRRGFKRFVFEGNEYNDTEFAAFLGRDQELVSWHRRKGRSPEEIAARLRR